MLNILADWLGPLHALFGFIGLTVFWVPVFVKKGGRWHVTMGRIFVNCAYVVLATASLAVVYRLTVLLLAGKGPAEEPVLFSFLLFLGYLALVTFVTVRHAIGVLKTKHAPDRLKTPLNMVMARLAIGASLVLIAYTLIYRPSTWLLLLALSPIGIGTGQGILKYLSGTHTSKRQWLYEHLGGMIGAGIAFHTAFAVFGFSQLFEFRLQGLVAVIPWVLPAMIGIPATVIWTRHYRKKYGEIT